MSVFSDITPGNLMGAKEICDGRNTCELWTYVFST